MSPEGRPPKAKRPTLAEVRPIDSAFPSLHQTLHRHPHLIPLLAMLAGVAASVVAAYGIVAKPDLFHLEISASNIVGGLLGLALFVLIIKHRRLALGVTVSLVYLNLSDVLVRYYGFPSILQLIVMPLLVRIWVDRHTLSPWRLAHDLITLVLVARILVLFSSALVAADIQLANEQIVNDAKAVIIFFLVSRLAAKKELLPLGSSVLVAAAGLVAGLGLLQANMEIGWIDNLPIMRMKRAQVVGTQFENRIGGPVGDPNFFAQVLIMVLPLAICLAVEARSTRRRILFLLATCLIAWATVLTYSRGGAIALVTTVFLSLVSFVPKRHKALAAFAFAGAFFLLPQEFVERVKTVRELFPAEANETVRPDNSIQMRKLLSQVAWQEFLANPVLGVGAGNYSARFADYSENVDSIARSYKDPGERRYPHNLYLETAAETGMFGLTTFGLAVILCFVQLSRARRNDLRMGDRLSANIARALQISLLSYLVTSLFLHGAFERYLWLLFGLGAAAYRASSRSASVVDGGSPKRPS